MKFVDNPEAAVLAAAKDMLRRGLVEGTAGNISARREDGNLVITPSSVDYADMALDDLVLVDPEGAVLQAKDGRSPSTEMKLHLACYAAFDDIGSVIHSHPVWATMFAVAHQPIPAAVDEFAVYCGGEIRCGSGTSGARGGLCSGRRARGSGTRRRRRRDQLRPAEDRQHRGLVRSAERRHERARVGLAVLDDALHRDVDRHPVGLRPRRLAGLGRRRPRVGAVLGDPAQLLGPQRPR